MSYSSTLEILRPIFWVSNNLKDPYFITTEKPFTTSCPTLSRFHFVLVTQSTSLIIVFSPLHLWIIMLLVPSTCNKLLSAIMALLFFNSSKFPNHALWPVMWFKHPVLRNKVLESTWSSATATICIIPSESSESWCARFYHSSSLPFFAPLSFLYQKFLAKWPHFSRLYHYTFFLLFFFLMWGSFSSFQGFRSPIINLIIFRIHLRLLVMSLVSRALELVETIILFPCMGL